MYMLHKEPSIEIARVKKNTQAHVKETFCTLNI